VALHQENPSRSAAKVARRYEEESGLRLHRNTVLRALKSGVELKEGRQRPQFFERAQPNARWQSDLIEEERAAMGTVQGVFYLDDYS